MENNMISSFSERLKELRAEKGIRSEDAAEVFGVSRATLSAYEMGKSVPDLNVLNKMADFYGVSTDYICGRTNVKKSLQADTSSVKLSQSDVNKISKLSDSETVGLSLLINSAQFKKMVKALAVCYLSAFYLDYYNERESKRSVSAIKKELKATKFGNADRIIRSAAEDFFSELSYPLAARNLSAVNFRRISAGNTSACWVRANFPARQRSRSALPRSCPRFTG